MAHLILEWGDGYLSVYPEAPDFLLKELRYWHRTLERRPGQFGMVATGEYRPLFSLNPFVDDKQNVQQRIVTMPGFLHRIRNKLQANGYTCQIIDRRTPPPAPDYKKAFEGLRDCQMPCTYAALASGGGIVACPTGWGKTHIMASIIKAYSHEELCARGTPLVVVATPEQDITRKDFQDLTELLPDRDVGIIMGGMKKLSDDVQVITLQSLHLLNGDDIGLVLVDEVHTAASERRMEIIMGAKKALKWGVSATPDGRFDGRDLVTEGLFGPVVYQRTYAEGIADGALVPIKVFWMRSPPPEHVRNSHSREVLGLEDYMKFKTRAGKYRNGVDRNDNRNSLIADLLARIPDKLQTLCIMQHLDHMDKLMHYCSHIRIVHGQTNGDALAKDGYRSLVGIPRKEREQTYEEFSSGTLRKIISTYVYKQGVNFPQLSVVINAGGGGSDIVARQIPGRESRNIEGKDQSYLIDFWHDWDTTQNDDGKIIPGPIHKDDRSREKAYRELGFEQVWIEKLDDLPFLRKDNDGSAG